MATVAEILAAADRAEQAGDMPAAKVLRDRAAQMQGPSPEAIMAAAEKAKAAGDKPAYDALIARLPKPQEPEGPATADRADPVAGTPEDRQRKIDDLALFEMANPALAGRFGPDDPLPPPGTTVMGEGGGRAAAAKQATVKPWRNSDVRAAADTFGDTAGAMMEGPIAAAKEFGGGLSGANPSPTRGYLANDPLTRNLPGPVLTGLGAVGDLGGAALSGLGAGVSGLIGLATEAVPGQTAADEAKLGNDLLGMSMVAVPELAGASSIPARVAAAAPKVAPVARAVPQVADDVAAAQRLGIPVMRTDIKPPETFIGKVAQKTGEAIPVAGTGGMRADQNVARVEAAQNFVREYGAASASPAIDDVTAALLEKRSADLVKFTTQKKEVIEGLAANGPVPVPKAVAAIDAEIARLRKQKMSGLDPVIAKLEEFKASLTDQRLTEIEANRKVIGEAFSGLDMGAIRSTGEKALAAVYGPLKEDMAAFIKSVGGNTALNKWGTAEAKLADMAGELGNNALKRALSKGEASPETVRSMLFSAKPSDVKLLYQNLDEKGRASARTAIVQEALSKAVGAGGTLDDLSPDKFKTALGRLGSQVGVFFKGDDLEAATGLVRALKLTERGAVAGVTPPTGIQNLPAIMGLGLGSMFGLAPSVAIGGGIGWVARIYERTGVKNALRQVARAETPKAQGSALQALDKALIDSGAVAGNAAAQSAANSTSRPEYEALWGRYGQ